MSADCNCALTLYDTLRKYLQLSWTLEWKKGDNIAEGELFKLKFTAYNAAPRSLSIAQPHWGIGDVEHFGEVGSMILPKFHDVANIVFLNPVLRVSGTSCASVVTAIPFTGKPFPDVRLVPWEPTSLVIDFKALRNIEGMSLEFVARARIQASLDLKAYFNIRQSVDAYVDIVSD